MKTNWTKTKEKIGIDTCVNICAERIWGTIQHQYVDSTHSKITQKVFHQVYRQVVVHIWYIVVETYKKEQK
jgi:hypothetical protein